MYVHGEDTRRQRTVQSTHFHSVWCIWSVMCYMFAKQSEGRRREADRESLNFRTAAKEGTQQKKKSWQCNSPKSHQSFYVFKTLLLFVVILNSPRPGGSHSLLFSVAKSMQFISTFQFYGFERSFVWLWWLLLFAWIKFLLLYVNLKQCEIKIYLFSFQLGGNSDR